jgi:N-methylhydantoinase A
MLMAPARIDRVASCNILLAAADWAAIAATFEALGRETLAVIEETGADLERRSVRRLADMRYAGQGSEITVTLPERLEAAGVLAAFEAAYRQLFGRTPPGAAAQIVTLRLSASAPMPGAGDTLCIGSGSPGGALLKGRRRVYFADLGERVETPVYDRYALSPGMTVEGPAVFEENESTFVVGPRSRISVLPDGSILAERVG